MNVYLIGWIVFIAMLYLVFKNKYLRDQNRKLEQTCEFTANTNKIRLERAIDLTKKLEASKEAYDSLYAEALAIHRQMNIYRSIVHDYVQSDLKSAGISDVDQVFAQVKNLMDINRMKIGFEPPFLTYEEAVDCSDY